MSYGRHVAFWVVTFVVCAAMLWLLRDILLPFVAGAALAYLLTRSPIDLSASASTASSPRC